MAFDKFHQNADRHVNLKEYHSIEENCHSCKCVVFFHLKLSLTALSQQCQTETHTERWIAFRSS